MCYNDHIANKYIRVQSTLRALDSFFVAKLKKGGKKHRIVTLSNKEKEYSKFLFYKNFFNMGKPIIFTEGKTDVMYIKAALKNLYKKYPNLIEETKTGFDYKIIFFKIIFFILNLNSFLDTPLQKLHRPC